MIGRDAKINLIDLWMEKPDTVAEIKGRHRSRSVENLEGQGLRGQAMPSPAPTGRRSS